MPSSLVDRVTTLLAEVVAEEVVGRFRNLSRHDIEEKPTDSDPDDIVTVVDRLVEARLERALLALLPGSVVIGEEAVHAQPQRLDGLARAAPAWLIDPIDGTKNFARGDDAFGVMIALVEAGVTRASWIALPARGQTFVAEAGGGASLNGVRVRTPARPVPLRGTFYTRFMPPALATVIERDLAGRYLAQEGPGAAAVEYTSVVQGEKDFVVYYRLHPWDHGPGALLLTEAGGRVEHADGRPYTPRSPSQLTILGASPAVTAAVRGWLPRS